MSAMAALRRPGFFASRNDDARLILPATPKSDNSLAQASYIVVQASRLLLFAGETPAPQA
jgi:hypothetical protein